MRVVPVALSVVIATSQMGQGQAFSSIKPLVGTTNFHTTSLLSTKALPETDTESKVVTEPIQSLATKEEFVNDGLLAWLPFYLDLFGVREGKSIAYGPIPADIDESKRLPPVVAAQRRKKAAENLQNIGEDERERRAKASEIMAAITATYVVWSTLLADNGGFEGHVLRFLSVIPLSFAVGYKLSAETGL